jgi:hypothetical protein
MNLPINSTPSHALMEIAPAPGHEASHAVPAADAAALSLVFLLVFCVVCFACGAAILGKRERTVTRQDPDNSTGETERASNGSQGETAQSRSEWEREADWWKR